ncbi:MAG: class I SAM-dependent methyltransferase, partial [Acidobacteria bacterium]|nr:class I SAM-dependent methyltransferase [Acidobacteriota bacterium]
VAPRVRAESPRILDIGAGFGHILYALGERFPKSRRTAIEFSGVAARHLQSIGVDVITEPVENVLPRMEGQFDVVVISHVLEHLLDPGAVLKLIRSSLAPNGVLYVEVPNIPADSLLRFPDHVWAPRFDEPHITFFSTGSLHTLLESRGLTALFCDTAGPFYRYISSLRFRMPTARWFIQHKMPPALFHFLRRQSFTKPVRMREREESFYQYGGCRIWIRSISQAGAAAE